MHVDSTVGDPIVGGPLSEDLQSHMQYESIPTLLRALLHYDLQCPYSWFAVYDREVQCSDRTGPPFLAPPCVPIIRPHFLPPRKDKGDYQLDYQFKVVASISRSVAPPLRRSVALSLRRFVALSL